MEQARGEQLVQLALDLLAAVVGVGNQATGYGAIGDGPVRVGVS
jgi:hypothetical protein